MRYKVVVNRREELLAFKIEANKQTFNQSVNCVLGRFIPKAEYEMLRLMVMRFCRDNQLNCNLDGPVKKWEILER